MHFVTDGTSFDTGRFMLINKGTAFIGMAFKAGLMFKSSKPFPDSRSMGVMAGSALQNSFLQPVPLIQLKFRVNIRVTTDTPFAGMEFMCFFMHLVAFGTIHGCFGVRPGHILCGAVFMAF